MSYRTAEPLADDEVMLGGIEVLAYLGSDGEECYRIRHCGDLRLSATLGLLEMAKADVIAQSDWRPAAE